MLTLFHYKPFVNTSRRIEPRREDKIEMGIVQRAAKRKGVRSKIPSRF